MKSKRVNSKPSNPKRSVPRSAAKRREPPKRKLQRLRAELRQLDPGHPQYRPRRTELLRHIELVKNTMQNSGSGAGSGSGSGPKSNRAGSKRRRPTVRPRNPNSGASGQGRRKNGANGGSSSTKKGLSSFLTAENIQESMKAVGNLRTFVRNASKYLNQADQVLDTFYTTSNSLKETGVLDKLIKGRGKNLNTDDFTNILMALMNSPMGGQLFKSMAGGEDDGSGGKTVESGGQPQQIPPSDANRPGPQ